MSDRPCTCQYVALPFQKQRLVVGLSTRRSVATLSMGKYVIPSTRRTSSLSAITTPSKIAFVMSNGTRPTARSIPVRQVDRGGPDRCRGRDRPGGRVSIGDDEDDDPGGRTRWRTR